MQWPGVSVVVLVVGSVGSVFSTALEVLVVGGNPDNGLKVGHQATPASCPTSQQSTAPGTPSPFSEDFDVVGSLHAWPYQKSEKIWGK